MSNLLKKFNIESQSNPHVIEQKYVMTVKNGDTNQKIKQQYHHQDKLPHSQPVFLVLLFSQSFHWKNYLFQLPTLLLGLGGFYISRMILVNVPPSSMQNLIIPNFYLPIFLSLSCAAFFSSWYLTQNMRRSFWLAALLMTVLEFQLHHQLKLGLIIALFLQVLLIELLLTYKQLRR